MILAMVVEAANGEEAIQTFRIHRPDVTLMDLPMPGTNGIDAILAIRKESPASDFIVLTTDEGDVHALRALKAGATGDLLKSMLRKNLLETIRAVHMKNILSKLGANDRTHAVTIAIKRGFTDGRGNPPDELPLTRFASEPKRRGTPGLP